MKVQPVSVNSNQVFGNKLPINTKMRAFLPEIYDTVLMGRTSLEQIGQVVAKHSPATTVKSFRELPAGANINERTGAYFHCMYNFNRDLTDVRPGSKAIYLRPPQQNNTKSLLEYLSSIIHEMTHIFQEESSDRVGKLDLLREFLKKGHSIEQKKDTLLGMPRVFAQSDITVQRPLIAALQKESELPQPVNVLSSQVLDAIYTQTVNCPVDTYIMKVLDDSLKLQKTQFPNLKTETVLDYVAKTALNEQEAYANSTNLLRTALSIRGPVDLDYRVLLFDRFAQVANK